ncbi:MAG TPA: glycerophosphodiester phosphodiesterase family protein [Croceibacterium sp.]|nr:glycerophosphodiester phosphodiesterase family protein [Croceibacterium sp.]
MKLWLNGAGVLLAVGFLALTFIDASWLAASPTGAIELIANRGVDQPIDRHGLKPGDCTAAHIETPYHPLIGDTLESLDRAKRLGAALVELDVAPTKDGHLVVFGDATLDCRTNGKGKTSDYTLAQIRALDAGHGYTADGGKTYPFRGKAVGLIPSLADYLQMAANKPLLFRFTTRDPADADRLAAALKAAGRDVARMGYGFYGSVEQGPVARIRQIYPSAWVFSDESAGKCHNAYALEGWLGITPAACRNGTLVVPLNDQWSVAGWPNRTIARMQAVGAHILMTGPQRGRDSRGLDLPEQLGEIPSTFTGYVLVDDIWNVGPALFPSLDHRSPDQQEAADRGLARRRGMP